MASRKQLYEKACRARAAFACAAGAITAEQKQTLETLRQSLAKTSYQLQSLAADLDDTVVSKQVTSAEGLVDQARTILFRIR